jgi:CRP-like cAMP-binding protein
VRLFASLVSWSRISGSNNMVYGQSQLAKKLCTFVPLSERELGCLTEIQSAPFHVAPGTELVHQGEAEHVAYILQAGWGCSFKLLHNGERQIITFPVPGDCVGLRSILLRTADHSFSALTDAVVSRVEVSRMLQIFNELPHLGEAVLWATSRDEAIVVEHLASIGRRNSLERTAHFFLELYDRLQLVGLTTADEFACPLTQYHLADALGLSAIHVNRVLRELRERGLITFQEQVVTIHDPVELKELAGYEAPGEAAVLIRETGP